MKSLRTRAILVLLLSLGALYYISPTIIYFSMPKDKRNDQAELQKSIPSWLPQKHIKLGLDLQGGVQLVLGVDTDVAIDNRLSRMGTEISRWANESSKTVKEAYAPKGQQTLRITLEEGVDAGKFREELGVEHPDLERVGTEGSTLDFKFKDTVVSRIRDASLEQAERVVRSRVDKWGVSEPSINRRADKSIMVQLPGFKEPEKARELLGRTAQLKFKMVDEEFKGFDSLAGKLPPTVTMERRGSKGASVLISEDKNAILTATQGLIPEGRELLFEETLIAGGKKTRYTGQVLKAATELSGEDVQKADVVVDSQSMDQRPVVSLTFTATGGKRFGDVTGANVGNRMAIVLDDVIISDPVIQTQIAGGSAQISMGADKPRPEIEADAQQLALILRSGALPAPITILEERQVGATLGPELANQGVMSVMFGLICVLVFITWYYKRPGFLSCVALVLNGVLLLALMASFGFALTLPGFAGFILTLGMAVDANILINERIIDELAAGRAPQKALENGFSKVFWTIVDANVTTLIAAFVLLETSSSGPIKGFSIALILGLLVSMFTALSVTRMLFSLVLSNAKSEKEVKSWLGWSNVERAQAAGTRTFNFLKYGKLVTAIGGTLIVAVLALALTKGFNWSVDFAGGTEMELTFTKPIEAGALREAVQKAGIDDPLLQAVGEKNQHYLVRFEGNSLDTADQAAKTEKSESIRASVVAQLQDYSPEVLRVEYVGPAIGKELRKQGILSVIWAVLGILIYVGLRFDMRFTPGAMAKMVQDVFCVLAFYLFFQRSFDLTAVAGVLTVVGYSVNDVIVIYDRIRENITNSPRRTLYDNINVALNETLARSINTSVASMVSLAGILIFGTSQILNFAIAMVIGIISATLTSTFLATTFVLWSEEWRKRRTAGGKVNVGAGA